MTKKPDSSKSQAFLIWVLWLIGIQPFFTPLASQTSVHIHQDMFYINNRPTYAGVKWNGNKIEGLLMNARMVQGIFDDENPMTRLNWAYPDTKTWDPDRNTREFVQNMESWYRHGMLAFTINLQGGSPMGYGNQGWVNSAFDPVGNLKKPYMDRLEKILSQADQLGMVVILGYFYFGQDEQLRDEAAIIRAVVNVTDWILEKGFGNVLVEINNECDNSAYDHEILKPGRVHELINLVKNRTGKGLRLYASTSFNGKSIPTSNVVRAADFILLHGNGTRNPNEVSAMVKVTRLLDDYRPMPVLFNEDDHFDFESELSNYSAAVGEYASWGYFDYRFKGEGYEQGFQSVPVDWAISSERKRGFFELTLRITGGCSPVK